VLEKVVGLGFRGFGVYLVLEKVVGLGFRGFRVYLVLEKVVVEVPVEPLLKS